MLKIYFICSFLTGAALAFNRLRPVKIALLSFFVLLQGIFTCYVITHRGTGFWYFSADNLAVIFITVLFFISALSIYHSFAYLKWRQKEARERNFYYAAMVLLVAALSCAYCANHIAITWVFVEITTIAASFLIYYLRTELALEGTWKYIFVCTISITFVFIGILFLGIAAEGAGLKELTYSDLAANAAKLDPFWTKMGFLFIFTGFTAKAGLFPMYTAGIDAKDKSPSPAGALFASGLMNVGFCGIFRTYQVVMLTGSANWARSIIMISAAVSIFIAAVYMIKVENYKRMLAYSSVEHMGIIMLGLAMGGIGMFAALFHLILHSFIKAAIFYQTGIAYRVFGSKMVNDTGGYLKLNVSGSMVLLFGFFCVIAVPPSGLFISEFLIFKSMFQSGYTWLMIIVMLLLTIIIWSFGSKIFKIVFTPVAGFNYESAERPALTESLSQIAIIVFIMVMGVCPPKPILDIIQAATGTVLP